MLAEWEMAKEGAPIKKERRELMNGR